MGIDASTSKPAGLPLDDHHLPHAARTPRRALFDEPARCDARPQDRAQLPDGASWRAAEDLCATRYAFIEMGRRRGRC